MNNLGSLYGRQGRLEEAEALFEQVRFDLTESLGPDHPQTLSTTGNLANILTQLGYDVEAGRLLEDVVASLETSVGPDHPSTFVATNNLAALLARTENIPRALVLLESIAARTLALFGPDHPDTLTVRSSIATIYRTQLRFAEAEEMLADMLPRYLALFGAEHPSTIRIGAALAETRLRMKNMAAQALLPAQTAAAAMDVRRATGGSIEAEGQAARESFAGADVYRILADALWQTHRQGHEGAASGAVTAEALRALQLAMEGDASRSIAQLATRRYAEDEGERIGTLAAKRQYLTDQYGTINERLGMALSRGDDDGRELADELRDMLAATKAELQIVDAELKRDFPAYFTLIQPSPLDADSLRNLFAADEAGLLIVPGRLGSHIVVVRDDKIVWRRVSLNREGVERAVRRLLWDVGADVEASDNEVDIWSQGGDGNYPFSRSIAHELHNALLAPMEDELRGVRHLFVASTGALSSLPLAVLVAEEPQGSDSSPESLRRTAWLGDKYAISQVPSLGSLAFLRNMRRTSRQGEPRGLIGFGNPVLADLLEADSGRGSELGSSIARRNAGIVPNLLGGVDSQSQPSALLEKIRGLNSLPGTARELEAIRTTMFVGTGSIYLGVEATEANFRTADIENASTIIIATHGLIAGELDGLIEPGLVFTPPDSFSDAADDGLLTASEIAGLRLNADWVILSACNTAAGDPSRDNSALSGLARAFFYAGAQSMLATYWPVRDDVAAVLSVRVLDLEAKEPSISRAGALQKAMREIREDTRMDGPQDTWAHPLAWAPFGLIGDGAR